MKIPQHYIKFDQAWLHYKREQEAKRERLHILAFATLLVVLGGGALWLCLTMAAKLM